MVCRYQSSLGNKRVELFEGAGPSEPAAEDHAQLASGAYFSLRYKQILNCTIIVNQLKTKCCKK